MARASSQNPNLIQGVLAVIVVLVLGFLAYQYMTTPDNRSFGQRLGDAFHTLPNGGVHKAQEQLEDRTPARSWAIRSRTTRRRSSKKRAYIKPGVT